MARDAERRRWPVDQTRLEILAFRAGLDADELRAWLRSEVGARYASAHAADDGLPLRLAPSAEELRWAEQQAPEVRDAVMAFFGQFDGSSRGQLLAKTSETQTYTGSQASASGITPERMVEP